MGRNIQMKVSFTLSAKKLLSEIKEVHGNDLLFHQSGGCCDGSAPMCFPAKEYQVGNSDVKLGEIDGTPFYINEEQKKIAEKIIEENDKELSGKVVTKLSKLKNYCKAEDYHQKYLEK